MLCLALIFVRLFDFVMSFCSFLRFSFFIPFRRRCLCKAFIFSLHFFLFDFLFFFFCSFDTNRKWFMQNSSAQLIQNLPRPLKRPTYTRFDCRTHFFRPVIWAHILITGKEPPLAALLKFLLPGYWRTPFCYLFVPVPHSKFAVCVAYVCSSRPLRPFVGRQGRSAGVVQRLASRPVIN